jgi:hypothetical protein
MAATLGPVCQQYQLFVCQPVKRLEISETTQRQAFPATHRFLP